MLCALMATLGACTTSPDDGPAPSSISETDPSPPTAIATVATQPLEPGPIMIKDGAYDPPDPLPGGRPGDVVAVDDAPAPEGASAWRMLYRSTTLDGQPTAVSGWVAVPTTPGPHGIVVFAHGTTGLGDQCAPTLGGGATPQQFAGLLADGWTVAATDYQGLGTPGMHHYLVADAAARSVLDIARAAAVMDPAASLDGVALVGFSQGGHAVLSAAERAGELAPEIGLVGVVAAAPAMQLREWFAAAPSGQEGYLLMIALAYADAYDVEAADWLTSPALQRRDEVEDACLMDAQAVGSALGRDAIATDASPNTPIGNLLDENEPGTTTLGMPVMIVTAGDDQLVTPDVADDLITRMCAVDTDVTHHHIPTGSHGALSSLVREPARQWLGEQLAPSSAGPADPCGGPWP